MTHAGLKLSAIFLRVRVAGVYLYVGLGLAVQLWNVKTGFRREGSSTGKWGRVCQSAAMLLWARHKLSREGKEMLGSSTSVSITQDSTGAQGRRQTSPQVANFTDVEASARGDLVGIAQVSISD